MKSFGEYALLVLRNRPDRREVGHGFRQAFRPVDDAIHPQKAVDEAIRPWIDGCRGAGVIDRQANVRAEGGTETALAEVDEAEAKQRYPEATTRAERGG